MHWPRILLAQLPLLFVPLTVAWAQPVWIEQGPGPLAYPIIEREASGAVNAIAIDPADASRIFIATVNGGIWRTENGTDSHPNWVPLADDFPTLAISCIAFSPLDPTHNTLFAGFGQFTSGGSGDHENPRGFAKTIDGGEHWTFFPDAIPRDPQFPNWPARMTRILPTTLLDPNTHQQVILAAVMHDRGGVYRSDDGGTHFVQTLAGAIGAMDLVSDPGNPSRLYAAIWGDAIDGTTGIYMSTDAGLSWDRFSNIDGSSCCGRLAVSRTPDPITLNRPVYVFTDPIADPHVYRSADHGTSWTRLPSFPDAEVFRQGVISLAADPDDPDAVFVGSMVPGVYRSDGSAWARLWDSVTGTTNCHVDSRSIVFDVTGDILEVDDGGVYRLVNPNDIPGRGARRWTPMVNNLRCTEMYTIAYDALNHVWLSGTQDNGVIEQLVADHFGARWENSGDGALVGTDDTSEPGHSIHYITWNQAYIWRCTYDASNTRVGDCVTLPLLVEGTGGQSVYEIHPSAGAPLFVVNRVEPTKLLITSVDGHLFESISPRAGDVVRRIDLAGDIAGWAFRPAFVYGGTSGKVPNPDVFYVGVNGGLWLRPDAKTPPGVIPRPGAGIRGIATDPDEWRTVAFVDETAHAWLTMNSRAGPWIEITGAGACALNQLCTEPTNILIVPRPAQAGRPAVIVTGRLGVFVTHNPEDGPGACWERLGPGLPNVMATDLVYNAPDDVLLVSTFGRGAWKVRNARQTLFLDTTPPVIACPPSISVECTSGGGTPAQDPQLAGFFAGVSAFDPGNRAPTVTNDAPPTFPLGSTLVTFTARDDAGNRTQCSATVTVLDRTPPSITLALTPSVLWPPNHRMVSVHANVATLDACDPAVSVRLLSVNSSEPEAGGSQIEGATIGTADFEFSLRAERSGPGPGRLYIACYGAMDDNGNAAQICDTVIVPHDQSGRATLARIAGTPTLVILGESSMRVRDARHVEIWSEHQRIPCSLYSPRLADENGDLEEDAAFSFDATGTYQLGRLAASGEQIFARWETELSSYLASLAPGVLGTANELPAELAVSVLSDPSHREPTIRYSLPRTGPVRLRIFDLAGREIARLVEGTVPAGIHEAGFGSRRIASQVCLYRLEALGRVLTGKFVVLK